MTARWTPSSWRALPAKHIPSDYPDAAALTAVEAELRALPPLVFAGEARNLTAQLGAVAEGRAFRDFSFEKVHVHGMRELPT